MEKVRHGVRGCKGWVLATFGPRRKAERVVASDFQTPSRRKRTVSNWPPNYHTHSPDQNINVVFLFPVPPPAVFIFLSSGPVSYILVNGLYLGVWMLPGWSTVTLDKIPNTAFNPPPPPHKSG